MSTSTTNNGKSACDISRRAFLKFGGAAALTIALPGAIGSLAGCRSEAGDAIFRHTRTVTDHAGREVAIPTADALERIYYTSPLAQIYVFTLAPELQGGTGTQFTSSQLKFLPEGTDQLKYMGSISAGGEIDREMLMKEDIQLIFSISGVELSPSNISDAEDLQNATGIPVVLVDGSFDKIIEAYRFVGDIMGLSERASGIATYLDGIYQDVTNAVKDIPDSEKVSIYYAEGPSGLSTEPSVSQHARIFEVAGAYNVAQVEESTSGFGMSAVSLESVIKWDPEVIIAWDAEVRGGAAEYIKVNDAWSGIKAVKNGRVYTMPSLPFAWVDRPNGVNRWLGLQWIANMLYPDRYDVDMVHEAKEFYKRLYWYELTDDEALMLLGNSYPPYGK